MKDSHVDIIYTLWGESAGPSQEILAGQKKLCIPFCEWGSGFTESIEKTQVYVNTAGKGHTH